MYEFECIEKYIRSLLHSGIKSENDDAAHITFSESSLIVTKDLIVEGIHFLKDSDPSLLGKKALRVNLSDLAAMGATPHSYLLGLSLPKRIGAEWWKKFSDGLKEDNEIFSIKLIGGDTTNNISDVIIISITALGTPASKILSRSGAKIGDYLYVSGTIGDATLGLMSYKGLISEKYEYLKNRYDLPTPKVTLGAAIANIASACIDISDGLLQDVEKLCTLSGVGAHINVDSIPLSSDAKCVVQQNKDLFADILTGGDDYELAFTVSSKEYLRAESVAESIGVKISKIGIISSEQQVHVYGRDGNTMHITKKGYNHHFPGEENS